jgi:shikimate 5-dehydrogenase
MDCKLVYQGAEAFNLWTGITRPVQEMFAVLRTGKKADMIFFY